MRNSGKTYRVILAACLAASEGKNVVVVSTNSLQRINAINIARQISEGFGKFTGVDLLKFPNGAWIRFFTVIDFNLGKHHGLNFIRMEDGVYNGEYFSA